MNGKFICGCDPKDPKIQGYYAQLVPFGDKQVLTNKRYDKQGNEICPIHGAKLYGSASITVRGPQGNEIVDYRAEFYQRYGKKKVEIFASVEDRRDNRDPSIVGAEYLSGRASAGNGHSETSTFQVGADYPKASDANTAESSE